MRYMKYDKWVATYNPVRFHHRYDSFDGTMLGINDSRVRNAALGCVWTLLDCDGKSFIALGYHRVNREGYFICAVPETKDVPDVRV